MSDERPRGSVMLTGAAICATAFGGNCNRSHGQTGKRGCGCAETASDGAAACREPAVCTAHCSMSQWRHTPPPHPTPPLPTAIACAVYNKDVFILVSVLANVTARLSSYCVFVFILHNNCNSPDPVGAFPLNLK